MPNQFHKELPTGSSQIEGLPSAILDSANFTIIATDMDGMITLCNSTALKKLGYAEAELVNRTTPVLIHDEQEIIERARQLSLELGREIEPGFEALVVKARECKADQHDWTYVCKDGRRFPVRLSVTMLRDASDNLIGYLGIGQDITETLETKRRLRESEARFLALMENSTAIAFIKEADERMQQLLESQKRLAETFVQLEHLATQDALTGLNNRGAFDNRLATEFSRSRRYQLPLSLLLLDVDHFKLFNDDYGHPAGDTALQQVAELLNENSRPSDFVARYGGEEFAVILVNTPRKGALITADRIREIVEKSNWKERLVTVSIGVAELSLEHPDQAAFVAEADQALYLAKAAGRNCVRTVQP